MKQLESSREPTAPARLADATGSVMLLHEICGKSPVHPKTMICMVCHTPVFYAECIRFPLTVEWIRQHPQAAEYIISPNEKGQR